MRRKRILMLIGSVCLALMLALPLVASCGPATPEEAAEEIAELESKLTAEKAKSSGLEDDVADLEDEIAALKAPGEVQEWEPATYAGAGAKWDTLVYICDYITEASDGRIVATPSQPGAVCPVEEQLDVVCSGATEAMDICPSYMIGKVPVSFLMANEPLLIDSLGVSRYLIHTYKGGRLLELYREAYSAYGNAYLVESTDYMCPIVLPSIVPINSPDDLVGLKIRTPGQMWANVLEIFGASTVWLPSTDLYTSLATGVIDGIIYSSVDELVALSVHEVATHWLAKPVWLMADMNYFTVNGTVWQNLPDNLKSIVEAAIYAGVVRGEMETKDIGFVKGWNTVAETGATITEWSKEDCALVAAAFASVCPDMLVDDYCVEAFDIIEQFMVEMGYWK